MTTRRVIVGGVVLLLGAATVAAGPRVTREWLGATGRLAWRPARLWTALFPTRGSRRVHLAALTPPEREAVGTLAKRLDGLIVWSSNRGGNHDLYLLDPGARSVRRLTTDPRADSFPRFSPDGRRLVFLRSQREGVSARDPTAWDVMLIDVDGRHERRLAQGGYHPTWTADGTGIVFERHLGERRVTVVRLDLDTGRETRLLDGARSFPGVEQLGDAELAPDGRRLAFGLAGTFAGAFGLRGPFSGAAVLDLAQGTLAVLTREQACQTTWAPDGQGLLWMETGGRGGTRVMTGQADGSGRRVFVDLPGAYSHEYFPRLSNDGRWLVWGAAAEGHEHDQADYELFAWEVATSLDRVVRLTHHPGNDQWPDLFVRR